MKFIKKYGKIGSKNMKIQLAKEEDLLEILEILKERCQWFSKNDIEQWGDWYYTELYDSAYFLKVMKLYTLYVVKEDDKVIGLFLLRDKNEKYWSDGKKACYIDHFVSKVGYPGLGKDMLKFIEDYAIKNQMDCLRLEAMKINPKINEYWEKQGFKSVGESDVPYSHVLREKRIK